MVCSLPGSSVYGDSPGTNTKVGCYALLQGIFPTQGLNPGLPHYKRILYCLSHQGSPRPIPSPEDLSDPGVKLESPALQADSLLAELPRRIGYSSVHTLDRRPLLDIFHANIFTQSTDCFLILYQCLLKCKALDFMKSVFLLFF